MPYTTDGRIEVTVSEDVLEQLPLQGNGSWKTPKMSVIDASEDVRIKTERLSLLKRRAERLIESGHPVQALKVPRNIST